eukprot:378484_1
MSVPSDRQVDNEVLKRRQMVASTFNDVEIKDLVAIERCTQTIRNMQWHGRLQDNCYEVAYAMGEMHIALCEYLTDSGFAERITNNKHNSIYRPHSLRNYAAEERVCQICGVQHSIDSFGWTHAAMCQWICSGCLWRHDHCPYCRNYITVPKALWPLAKGARMMKEVDEVITVEMQSLESKLKDFMDSRRLEIPVERGGVIGFPLNWMWNKQNRWSLDDASRRWLIALLWQLANDGRLGVPQQCSSKFKNKPYGYYCQMPQDAIKITNSNKQWYVPRQNRSDLPPNSVIVVRSPMLLYKANRHGLRTQDVIQSFGIKIILSDRNQEWDKKRFRFNVHYTKEANAVMDVPQKFPQDEHLIAKRLQTMKMAALGMKLRRLQTTKAVYMQRTQELISESKLRIHSEQQNQSKDQSKDQSKAPKDESKPSIVDLQRDVNTMNTQKSALKAHLTIFKLAAHRANHSESVDDPHEERKDDGSQKDDGSE